MLYVVLEKSASIALPKVRCDEMMFLLPLLEGIESFLKRKVFPNLKDWISFRLYIENILHGRILLLENDECLLISALDTILPHSRRHR